MSEDGTEGRSAGKAIHSIQGRGALCIGEPERAAPRGWQWVRLDEIARLESGHTPSRGKPEYWGGDVGWVSIPDARTHHGGEIHDTTQTITELGLANSSARVLPKGTVSLCRTAASIGYVLIFGRPLATSQDFVCWVCTEALDPRFLQYLLMTEGREIVRFGKGSTHPTIYFEAVQEFRVCLPPVPEQQRIVAKLDELLARSRRAREALAEVPALVARYRESVLAAAFRGDLTADWREANPAAEPADVSLADARARRKAWQVVSGALASLPQGWAWTALANVLDELKNGIATKPEGQSGVRILRISAVRPGRLALQDVRYLSPDEPAFRAYELADGDLLFTRYNGNADLVGACAQVRGLTERTVYPDKLIRGRVDRGTVIAGFVELAANHGTTRAAIRASTKSAAGQVGISGADLRTAPVPVPPLAEQREIVRRVEAAFARIDAVEAAVAEQRARLDAYDRSLLARAFAGELVPQDPADEPAAALLARLRAERGEAAPARGRRRRG
ncbi:MAG: restriction endonuclease subunit S [Polyangiales bacterium]